MRVKTTVPLLLAVAAVAIACSSQSRRSGFDVEKEPTDPNAETLDGGNGGNFGGGAQDDGRVGNTCIINNTATDLDKDFDGDGYPLRYDCNECDPNANRGAFDVPGNGIDESCSGTPDDDVVECDDGLPLNANDPFDAAKAIGLCKKADPNGKDWGVVDAKWVLPDGTALTKYEGVGILTQFGVNAPQHGKSMLVLSSGTARGPLDQGFKSPSGYNKNSTHSTPPGYPKESPACPGVVSGEAHDGAALEIKLRVPSNAKSFKYQQNFFTYEYPNYICSRFNDFFVTMMDPPPPDLADGNIAFDQDGNPISVNNSFLQVCTPGTHSSKTFNCPLGTSTLEGTGFDVSSGGDPDPHAATGWLTTTVPVVPGSEITLRFAIWDSGDGILDSTVLIDDFSFSAEPATGATTQPTQPK